MGVNRPREQRQNQKPDVEQETQEAQEVKPERNPITDPPQGEIHTEVEEGNPENKEG